MQLRPIGRVESPLTDRAEAPKQGDEGAPEAWLVFEPEVLEALEGLDVGAEVMVLTWLHEAPRDVLACTRAATCRGRCRACSAPARRCARTRSACTGSGRGLEGSRVRVTDMEAVDGTPVLDVKSVLGDER